MELTWSGLGVLMAGAFFTAAILGWFIREETVAYPLALGFGVVLISVPIFLDSSNRADGGQGIFLLLPLVLGWLVLGVIAVASARELRSMWNEWADRNAR